MTETQQHECPYGGLVSSGLDEAWTCGKAGGLCHCCREDRADARAARLVKVIDGLGWMLTPTLPDPAKPAKDAPTPDSATERWIAVTKRLAQVEARNAVVEVRLDVIDGLRKDMVCRLDALEHSLLEAEQLASQRQQNVNADRLDTSRRVDALEAGHKELYGTEGIHGRLWGHIRDIWAELNRLKVQHEPEDQPGGGEYHAASEMGGIKA